jgi:hypothetical protein
MIKKLSLYFPIFFVLLALVSAQQIGVSGPVQSSPTLADLDQNLSNGLEIVVGTNNDRVHTIYSNGTSRLNWRIDLSGLNFMNGFSSAAVADLKVLSLKSTFVPNATGSNSQWAFGGNSSIGDYSDVQTDDGNGSYILGNTDNQKHTFNLQDTVETGTIVNVTVYATCREEGGGADDDIEIKTITSAEYTGTRTELTTSFVNYSEFYATNPNGSNWEWGHIDSMEIGVNYRQSGDAGDNISCTRLFIEVRYNDSVNEILIGGQKTETMAPGPKPGYIWAYNNDGSQMWRYGTVKSSIYSSPVVEDIDGNSDYEVLIGSNNNKLYALQGNGGLYWSKSFGGSKISTVAVGDVNEDGDPEIVVSSSDGKIHILRGNGSEINWMQTGGIDISSPTLADLDNDGDLEIITGSKDGKVYAWHGNGSLVSGWPAQAGPIWSLSPAVGDLDFDGLLEVVVITKNNDVYAYEDDGTLLSGFPLTHPERKEGSSPALADLDGDGKLEIILGTSYHYFDEDTGSSSNGGRVYAWYINGTIVGGFPKSTSNWISSSPAVFDIDGDNKNEIIIGSDDGNLYIWETGSTSWNQGWPMFHYNQRNTRMYDAPTVRVTSPVNGSLYLNATLSLKGTANDLDGSVTSYEWSSDIDGILGSSSSLNATLSSGAHIITLAVIDDSGKVAKARSEITILPYSPPSVEILNPDLEAPQAAGANITWSCLGNDTEGDRLRYMFRIRGPSTNNTWVTMRGYRVGRKWTWATTDADVGETAIRCVVKDLHGLKTQRTQGGYEITGPVNTPPTIDFLNPTPAEPQPAGSNVTWSCLGNDSEGDLIRYMFRLRGPSTNDTWVTMRGFRVGRKWKWQTSLDDVGNTDIKCVVKDYPAQNKVNTIYHNYEIT